MRIVRSNMMMSLKKIALALAMILGGVSLVAVPAVQAQTAPPRTRPAPAPGPLGDAGISPRELQRLFDAYVVMQAQQELGLSDEQYPKFLARVKTLQDVRRQGLSERAGILLELRRLSQGQNTDDGRIRAQLKALADSDARIAESVRQAVSAVDEVLDLRQQARFRLFEEQMERRKVELLMRVRQGNRPRNQF